MSAVDTREIVYTLLTGDPQLAALGYTPEFIYSGLMAPDSPMGERFIILRWGTSDPGVTRRPGGGASENLSIWVYNRQTDYGPILDALARCRTLLDQIRADPNAIQVDWQGDSEDLWDDVWRAVTRNSSYRIPRGG